MRGGDEEEVLLVCLYVHVCLCVCVCVCVCVLRVYVGVALEHVFYLLSHGCRCDGRVGAAAAHGNRISLCIPGSDVEAPWGGWRSWRGGGWRGGGVGVGVGLRWQHVPHFPVHGAQKWLLAELSAGLCRAK